MGQTENGLDQEVGWPKRPGIQRSLGGKSLIIIDMALLQCRAIRRALLRAERIRDAGDKSLKSRVHGVIIAAEPPAKRVWKPGSGSSPGGAHTALPRSGPAPGRDRVTRPSVHRHASAAAQPRGQWCQVLRDLFLPRLPQRDMRAFAGELLGGRWAPVSDFFSTTCIPLLTMFRITASDWALDMAPTSTTETFPLSEILGALSLATDLADGQAQGSAMGATVLATRIGQRMGLDPAAAAGALLVGAVALHGVHGHRARARCGRFRRRTGDQPRLHHRRSVRPGRHAPPAGRLSAEGCPKAERAQTVDAIAGLQASAYPLVEMHCDQARALSRRLPVPKGVPDIVSLRHSRWDGLAPLHPSGDDLPVNARIMEFATAMELHRRAGGMRVDDRRGAGQDRRAVRSRR